MIKLSKSVLARRVFRKDILDQHIKNFMLGQTKPYLCSNKITLDIGAAVGMYASYFAKYSLSVFCYEAVPEVFKQLEKTCSEYNNMYCANLAISNIIGETSFYVDDKRLSNSSIYNLVNGIEITVPCKTVDSMEHYNIGFIKIDVEGAELLVLRGAEKTIGRDLPALMIEVYPKFLPKDHIKEIFDLLVRKFGYVIYYNNRPRGLTKILNFRDFNNIASNEKMINIHDGDFLFINENSC